MIRWNIALQSNALACCMQCFLGKCKCPASGAYLWSCIASTILTSNPVACINWSIGLTESGAYPCIKIHKHMLVNLWLVKSELIVLRGGTDLFIKYFVMWFLLLWKYDSNCYMKSDISLNIWLNAITNKKGNFNWTRYSLVTKITRCGHFMYFIISLERR